MSRYANKNQIIFTQDVAGERAWLQKCFDGCLMFESEFSGLWPEQPFVQDFPAVWEIPPDSSRDLSQIECATYKSLYQLDKNFVSPKWCEADNVLINNINFDPQPRASKAQVIHLARSGTVFLETILYNYFCYTKDRKWNPRDPSGDHYWVGGDDTVFYNLISSSQPDIYFVYRKNWWDWLVSLKICENFGFHHYSDNIDWQSFLPFEITEGEMEKTSKIINATWNGLCHFRTHFPRLNFYIIEFSDLIKHQHMTTHRAISYDKQRLIENYNEARILFESKYSDIFDCWASRCLNHLQTMGCKVIKNFDHLID